MNHMLLCIIFDYMLHFLRFNHGSLSHILYTIMIFDQNTLSWKYVMYDEDIGKSLALNMELSKKRTKQTNHNLQLQIICDGNFLWLLMKRFSSKLWLRQKFPQSGWFVKVFKSSELYHKSHLSFDKKYFRRWYNIYSFTQKIDCCIVATMPLRSWFNRRGLGKRDCIMIQFIHFNSDEIFFWMK